MVEDIYLTEDESEKAVINEWRVDFREPMPPSEVRTAIANAATDKAIEKMVEYIQRNSSGSTWYPRSGEHGFGTSHIKFNDAAWQALKDMVKK